MKPVVRAAVVSLLLVSAGDAIAIVLPVVAHGIEVRSCDGDVTSRQSCPGAACRTLTFPLASLPQSHGLNLPAGRWDLTVESLRCWAPPITVDPGGANVLPVWPAAEIHGTIANTSGDTVSSLTAEFRFTGETSEQERRFSIVCPVVNSRWSCRAPAAEFQLRLSLDRRAPRYVHLNIPPDERKDLGEIRFEPGASVAGTIAKPGGRHEETIVELIPESTRSQSLVGRRTVVNESSGSLFQFTGVPRGVYRLTVSRPGWFPAEVKSIQVEEARESFLDEPVHLTRAAAIRVFITPALSTEGEPWLVRIESTAAVAPAEPIAESPASFSGEWRNEALHAGKYALSVVDRQGSVFLRETVEARIDAAPRFLNILKIHVRGIVKLGAVPFASQLVFTDDDGSSRITLKSDAAGKFDGVLSHEGRWYVQVLDPANTFYIKEIRVEVKRSPEQAVALLSISLPGAKAIGHVTNEAGDPGRGDVIVFRDGRGIADALIMPDGSFEVDGLDPGPVTLQALARGAESDEVSYLAAEDDPATAELRLQTLLEVKGQLLSEDGFPIAGAVIRYAGAGMARFRQAISGPAGEFSVRVPRGTTSLLASISASGFPATLRNLSPDAPGTQRIILGTASASLHIVQRPGAAWPFVTLDGQAFLRVSALLSLPSADGLPGLVADGLQVQVTPGFYTICYAAKVKEACQSASVAAGHERSFFPPDGPSR